MSTTCASFRRNTDLSADAFPSSGAFDAINDALTSDPAEQKNAIKQGQAVFAFKLKNSSGKEEAWHIDLKESGTVAKGEAPAGKKADGGYTSYSRAVHADTRQSRSHYQTRTSARWLLVRQRRSSCS